MKKNCKILFLVLNFILVCINSHAYDFESNGIYYNIGNNNTVSVTSGDTKYEGKIIIPSEVTHNGVSYNVTCIGNDAFYDCYGLTSVMIPNSVTSIGECAFRYCSSLTSVSIGNGVTTIGDYALAGCRGLSSIFVSSGNTKYDSRNNCNAIIETSSNTIISGCTNTAIPNSVTNIGDNAFYECSGLTSITIPNSVTSIGNNAFSYCSGLTSIIVSSGNTKYDSRDNCNAIIETSSNTMIAGCKNTIIPSSVTSIGNSAFYGCNELTSITIPNSVTSIGKYAFYECTSLTTVTIGNGVTRIGDDAFSDCTGLTSITLPNSVTSIGGLAFYHCSALASVVSEIHNPFSIDYDVFSYISSEAILQVPKGTKSKYEAFPGWTKNFKEIVERTSEATNYTLSIIATGDGSVSYNGITIRNRTTSFTVDEGASATITFTPDNGNSIASVKLNNSDITSQISGNSYTVNNITANTTLSVTFQEDVNALTVDGLNYTVTSQSNKTVTLTSGGTGLVLTVPATITQNGTTWKVTGIDKDALKGNIELAAIIWNPEAAFTATVSNPNLLLYVKSSDYVPAEIQNVVVNGTASNIVLTEAQSGNNFNCPQSFVAQKISYTHNYKMQTGIGEARGWETIALPFDVQTITHATKGEIKPFANWKSGDAAKPFWLYELAGTGFVETGSIKAYTPYIISMPNNPQYDSQWLLNGKVTFAASSVTIGKTENLSQPTFNGRTFIPCLTDMDGEMAVYSLNVNNDYESNNSGMTEGSMFVWKLRHIHPFEAYMTSTSSAPQYAFGVFEGMTTGIQTMVDGRWMKEDVVYDLQGRKLNAPSKKGVYIVNGKKKIIK